MTILYKILKQLASRKKQWNIVTLFPGSLIAILILTNATCKAQTDLSFSVGLQMNFAEIELETSEFESSFKDGAGIIVGISKGLNETWSLHSGVGFNYYEAGNSINTYSSAEDAIDMDREAFEFRYSASNYSETQKLTAVSIPIAIQYESFGEVRFYSKIGAEANVFINEKSDARASSLTTSGFFPRFNAVLDGPEFAGFGTYANQKFNEKDLNIKSSFNAFLELGVKQIYPSGNALYVGGFFKYGLNDISNGEESNGLISYNSENPVDFRSTSVLNALKNPQDGSERISTKANFHFFGITLRYEFDLQFLKPTVKESKD